MAIGVDAMAFLSRSWVAEPEGQPWQGFEESLSWPSNPCLCWVPGNGPWALGLSRRLGYSSCWVAHFGGTDEYFFRYQVPFLFGSLWVAHCPSGGCECGEGPWSGHAVGVES